jgi:DNA transformation protein
MGKLTDMPNIGKELAQKLKLAGISDEQQLKETGSEDALIRIDTIKDGGACINMLYALEGAIQGIRWHGLSPERKDELKEFYRRLKKG